MWTASSRFDGAGLLGRQLSAAGLSVTHNASSGRGSLEQLFFPIGPFHFYLEHSPKIRLHPKFNVPASTVLLMAVIEQDFEFHLGQSISAGAPVFKTPPGHRLFLDGDLASGVTVFGTIVISGHLGEKQAAGVAAHERAHVLQSDLRFLVFSEPPEEWIIGHLPSGPVLYRYFDLDLTGSWIPKVLYSGLGIPREDRLYELEAEFLEAR